MSPPLQEAAAPVVTQVPENENTAKVLPHADPTFYEVARRLDWPRASWELRGPEFEDGTRPKFEIEWRLGELIMRMLMRYANAKLSRAQRKELEQGAPLTRIRLVKKINPTAVEFGDRNSGGVHTETDQ